MKRWKCSAVLWKHLIFHPYCHTSEPRFDIGHQPNIVLYLSMVCVQDDGLRCSDSYIELGVSRSWCGHCSGKYKPTSLLFNQWFCSGHYMRYGEFKTNASVLPFRALHAFTVCDVIWVLYALEAGHSQSIDIKSLFVWQSMTNNSQLLSACLKEVINFQCIVWCGCVCNLKHCGLCVYWEKS